MSKIDKTLSQAQRIIQKFGNATRLCRLLNAANPDNTRNPSSIYRWTYPRSMGGTGGIIPTDALPAVIRAARMDGIYLTAEDLYPDGLFVAPVTLDRFK